MSLTADQQTPETSDEEKVIPVQNKESARYCWVCFATDEEDTEAAWVRPCNCRGTTKWAKKSNLKNEQTTFLSL